MKNYCLLMFVLAGFLCPAQTTLNAYARITTISGGTVLDVSNVNIANHTFTVGGDVIIMQMQDDAIGSNTTNASTFGDLSSIANAGRYEVRTISTVSPSSGTPTTITLSSALGNTYNTGTNSSVQLISFRDLGANFTTTANISGLTWNGNIGGVVAFYVTNTLTLNHRILADGLGFRGGTFSNNNGGPVCTAGNNTVFIANNANYGFKGEGIYRNTNNAFNNARGKLLNGGGGGVDHNAGGGGGGNFTAGGQGGNGYNNCTTFPGGGLGGLSLSAQISASRIFMGGGGGGGQQNNSQNSAGANGGGIILIKASQIETNTTCGSSIQISANGNTAPNGGNDGMGGGGAAGSIVIQATTFSINATCPLSVRASGGSGGNVTDAAAHAGGGGGAQGVIIYSSAQPTANVTTVTNNGAAGTDNSGGTVSASPGSGTSGTGIIASSAGPLPIELLEFSAKAEAFRILLNWSTASEKNNDYFTIEKSINGIDYVAVSKTKGAGTCKCHSKYTSQDNEPMEGTSYYRLKQTDFNRDYKYSPVVSVQYSGALDFSFFPNPVKSGDAISFKLNKNSGLKNMAVSISDLSGKELYAHDFTIAGEENEFLLNTLTLREGIYLLKIKSGALSHVKKLVIN